MSIDVYLTRLVTLKAANDRLQEELDSAQRVSEERERQRDALITYNEGLEVKLKALIEAGEAMREGLDDETDRTGDYRKWDAVVNAVLQPNSQP